MVEPMLDEGRDIQGREIPEFQVLVPALREEESAEAIVVCEYHTQQFDPCAEECWSFSWCFYIRLEEEDL